MNIYNCARCNELRNMYSNVKNRNNALLEYEALLKAEMRGLEAQRDELRAMCDELAELAYGCAQDWAGIPRSVEEKAEKLVAKYEAMKNPHLGSSFDSWLEEEGIKDEVTKTAKKAVKDYEAGMNAADYDQKPTDEDNGGE